MPPKVGPCKPWRVNTPPKASYNQRSCLAGTGGNRAQFLMWFSLKIIRRLSSVPETIAEFTWVCWSTNGLCLIINSSLNLLILSYFSIHQREVSVNFYCFAFWCLRDTGSDWWSSQWFFPQLTTLGSIPTDCPEEQQNTCINENKFENRTREKIKKNALKYW